jgi:hypothetical protein
MEGTLWIGVTTEPSTLLVMTDLVPGLSANELSANEQLNLEHLQEFTASLLRSWGDSSLASDDMKAKVRDVAGRGPACKSRVQFQAIGQALCDALGMAPTIIEQLDAKTTFLCVQWLGSFVPARTCCGGAIPESLFRFVSPVLAIVRKHLVQVRTVRECCNFYGEMYGLDGICVMLGDKEAKSNFSGLVYRVTSLLGSLRCNNLVTEPVFCLGFLRALSKLLGAHVTFRTTGWSLGARLLIEYFTDLAWTAHDTNNLELWEVLKSPAQGCVADLTRLMHFVASAPRTVRDDDQNYAVVSFKLAWCAWNFYKTSEEFSEEDVQCLDALARILSKRFCRERLYNDALPGKEMLAKVVQVREQRRRWSALRASWIGAVASHQAALPGKKTVHIPARKRVRRA